MSADLTIKKVNRGEKCVTFGLNRQFFVREKLELAEGFLCKTQKSKTQKSVP
jgi:hypothetical protein